MAQISFSAPCFSPTLQGEEREARSGEESFKRSRQSRAGVLFRGTEKRTGRSSSIPTPAFSSRKNARRSESSRSTSVKIREDANGGPVKTFETFSGRPFAKQSSRDAARHSRRRRGYGKTFARLRNAIASSDYVGFGRYLAPCERLITNYQR